MRIREIYDIIIKNEDKINIEASGAGNNNVTISKYDITTKALKNISKIKGIDILVDTLFSTDYGAPAISNSIVYSHNQYSALNNHLEKIRMSVKLLKDVLEQQIEPQDENTIALKLYEFENFKDLNDFTSSINKKIFAPLYNLNINIKVGDFEKGSHWINIIIDSSLGLSLLVNVIRQAYDILIHDYARFRVVEDIISDFEKNGKKIDELGTYLQGMINEVYDRRIENVIANTKKDSKLTPEELKIIDDLEESRLNELKSALRFSIEESCNQMERGLEIYQALDIPEEKRYKFPSYKSLPSKKKIDEIENE